MIDESKRLLELCNARLKAGKIGVALELRGAQDWIYLRGTFPPKPGSGIINTLKAFAFNAPTKPVVRVNSG